MGDNESDTSKIHQIFIAPSAGTEMQELPEVLAVERQGLEGDRYFRGEGFWQTIKNPRQAIRHVSFMRLQDIEEANLEFNSKFKPKHTRRNIVLDAPNLSLEELEGREFQIGEVRFRGAEECTPCKRPSQLSEIPNFANAFKSNWRGGLRAEILTTGIVRVGHELMLVDDQQ